MSHHAYGNWATSAWYYQQHHPRYVLRVTWTTDSYPCQDCHGAGGESDVVLPEEGTGPWEECGWCEGTGRITRWRRGLWLRTKREEKQHALDFARESA